MSILRLVSRTLFAYVGVACIGFVQPAVAQQSCAADTDCLKGFICETDTLSCPDTAPCRDGEKCAAEVACESEEYSRCVSGPCTGDTDCADGMVCLTETHQQCSGAAVACQKGQECPEPEPAECNTVTESECVPKYLAPCALDADCGEGFACVQGQECGCSTSAGSSGSPEANTADAGAAISGSGTDGNAGSAQPDPAADADAGNTPTSSDCGCKPSGRFRCKMKEITCDTDAGCPSGWTCVQSHTNSAPVACSATKLADGGVTTTCADAGPAEPASKQCVPPYYDTFGSEGASAVDSVGKGETQTPVTVSNDEGSAGRGANTSADADTSGGSCGNNSENSGCRVALGHTGPTAAWAILAGLISLLGLRRRRAA